MHLLWIIVCALTPAEALQAAAADMAGIEAARQAQTRYLLVDGGDADVRRNAARVVGFVLNSISRTRAITLPEPLDDQWHLLRVDLAAYSDLRNMATYRELFQAWEELVERDPYFHLRTQVSDGKSVRTVTTDGGWVDLDAAARLKEQSRSFGAVLRADYFIAHAAGDAYYRWAGIPAKEADFFKLFGVDTATVNTLAADSAANLLRSGVTHKPRRVIERPGVFGSVFQTKDVDAESPDRDPFRSPVDVREQRFNFQASEFFAMGGNRLWRVALYDAAGNRAETVPDRVAKDFAGDGIVRPLVTCLRCHERNGGLAGLQPFHDDQSDLLRQSGLSSYLPEVVQRIGELYDPPRLGKAIERAREDYTAAVAEATDGLSTGELTDLLVSIYTDYLDAPVTPARAAAELGIKSAMFVQAVSGTTDPILLSLAQGKSVNRAAWEAAYPSAAVAAESFKNRGKQP